MKTLTVDCLRRPRPFQHLPLVSDNWIVVLSLTGPGVALAVVVAPLAIIINLTAVQRVSLRARAEHTQRVSD